MEAKTPSAWRWLGRMGLLILACLVTAAAAWGFWWWEAKRRCDASIAAIQARGLPVRWSDFALDPEPSNQQNAAWYVTQAASSLRGTPSTGYSSPAFATPAWTLAVERAVAANPTAFDLLRKARSCKLVNWGSTRDEYGHPPIPTFINASSLARLVRDKALLHHVRGQERQAIECWRDIEAQSRIIGYKPTTLVSGLLALIVNGIGVESLEQIAPDIRLGGPAGLDPAAVRALIAELEQDRDFRESVAQAFLCERLYATNFYLMGLLDRGPWLLRPMSLFKCQRRWEESGKLAENIRNCIDDVYPRAPSEVERLFGAIPQFTGVSRDVIRYVLRRRVVAITLAIQLYRHEHGAYPASLESLVPHYLHAVPLDPRSANTRPLGYLLLADSRRPVVYSAGFSKLPPDQILPLVPANPITRWRDLSGSLPEVIFFDASAWSLGQPSTTQRGNDQP